MVVKLVLKVEIKCRGNLLFMSFFFRKNFFIMLYIISFEVFIVERRVIFVKVFFYSFRSFLFLNIDI